MSYTKSTDFLHLPQYSEMDVLNVLSDFNKAMYNIDVGVSAIHMIVNNVLLSGNLTQEELEKVKKQIADLSSKTEVLEASLSTLKTTVETNENNTTTELENLHNEIIASNTALEKMIDEARQNLLAIVNSVQTDIENLEKSVNQSSDSLNAFKTQQETVNTSVNQSLDSLNTFKTQQETVNTSVNVRLTSLTNRIDDCEQNIPTFFKYKNPSFTVNSSDDTVSNMTILREKTVHSNYNKEDVYISFNYNTNNEPRQNLELSFQNIDPLTELLDDFRFIKYATASATGNNADGYVMPISCGVAVRYGKLQLLFTSNDPVHLPNKTQDNYITIHLSGFRLKN